MLLLPNMQNTIKRCGWCLSGNEAMIKYHDTEWGVPLKNDKKIFEYIVLDAAQAGLSWQTIINRRKGYKEVFDNFDFEKCAKYSDKELEKKLKDERIIRNRLKVFSVRTNARAFIEVRKEFGTFSKYIWSFTQKKVLDGKIKEMKDIPSKTELSDLISKDLKKRGFTFVGSTIVYAFLQAMGIVNDHEITCFRYKELKKLGI